MSKHHKLCKDDYRKIWIEANGEIPKGYHIHHIDGNPYNNDISNLMCVSPEEHGMLHQNQFAKWASIGGKMGGDKCKEEKLGWFAASLEQRIEWSSGPRKEEYGAECTARLKADYASGKENTGRLSTLQKKYLKKYRQVIQEGHARETITNSREETHN